MCVGGSTAAGRGLGGRVDADVIVPCLVVVGGRIRISDEGHGGLDRKRVKDHRSCRHLWMEPRVGPALSLAHPHDVRQRLGRVCAHQEVTREN